MLKYINNYQQRKIAQKKLKKACDLTDSIGEIGKKFNKELASTYAHETLSKEENTSRGSYSAYTRYYRGNSDGLGYSKHSNVIEFNSNYIAKEDVSNLLVTRIHEGIHAMQYKNAGCLHTIPENLFLNVALTPRSYIWQKQVIEHDAFAKEALILTIASEEIDINLSSQNLRNTNKFKGIFNKNNGDLEKTLTEYSLSHIKHSLAGLNFQKSRNFIPFRLKYDLRALDYYTTNLNHLYNAHKDNKHKKKDIEFVTLGPKDIKALGNSFMFNFFTNPEVNPLVKSPNILAPDIEELIEELNEGLGIKDESQLRTFSDVLDANNLTHKEFAQICRSQDVLNEQTPSILNL